MDLKKEIALNKKILIILVLISVLTIGVNVSYSLFQTSVKLDNVVEIHTATEFPIDQKDPEGAAKDLIEKAENEVDGIEGINPATGGTCTVNCKEYRYTGPTVKNYVKLKNIKPDTVNNDEPEMQDELWRIIGIFTDEETQEKYIRIVKNEVLSETVLPTKYIKNGITYSIKNSGNYVYWNYKDSGTENNDWSTAGLQYYLNTEQDEGSNKGYMSYLSEETKSFLEERTHYLGTFMDDTDTAVSGYQHERDVKSCVGGKGAASSFPTEGCNVWDGNDATWEGSISLMYPSDYGFSADKGYWTSIEIYNYDGGAYETSWMYTTMPDAEDMSTWMLVPSSTFNNYVLNGHYNGSVSDRNFGGARPVLNLKSNVRITNIDTADGSIEKPYELGI